MIVLPTLLRWALTFKNRVFLKSLGGRAKKVTAHAERFRGSSEEHLASDVTSLKHQIAEGATPEHLEVPLFALTCEYAHRRLGMRPYDVQLLAALMLRRGKVIQMETGEGKTLVAPFHAIMAAFLGHQVTIVTPNDYLAHRDANWMRPLYEAFGLSVSTVQPTDSIQEKQIAYGADVVYVSTASVVFDWLRTRHALTERSALPVGRDTAIIDEIDAVLLDQAVQQYVLASPIDFRPEPFAVANQLVSRFSASADFEARAKISSVELTEAGFAKVDQFSGVAGLSPADGLFYVRAALAAHHLYKRDRDYIVTDGEVVPLDSQSGRPMHGSKFEYGVQQAIDQKEGLPISHPNTTINQITLQSFFSGFRTLCGMSGSAVHNALEFKVIYGLDVVPIPPNRRRIRVDHDDHVYRTRAVQAMAAVENVATMLQAGRPVLVGTTNIQDAEAIGELCTRRGISSRVLSAKNHFEEAAIIEEAGKAGRVTIAAQMAGRGVDIRLDEAARAAGGLQVLGIGRSEARRLDEQLIGRAGRQGDPGSSLFILSLEDDLFATMSVGTVKALISKFQLDETDPIKHRLVTRAIRRAQRNLVLVRFSQRQIALLFDQYVNASREAVFRRRATLFASASYEQEIERLIGRYVDRLGQVPPDDLHEELARLEDVLAIHVPEGVYVAGQRGAWRDELTEVIKRTYADRRAQAEPYAPARERVVLLRSIDYCWSLFLERTSLDFDSLLAVFSGRFGSERDQELRRRFLGATSKLNAEIDDTTLRFLMRLHDPIGLRDIKFWRGLGLAYRGNGDVDLADGLAPSPDTWILPASPTQEPEKPRGGLPPPKGPPRRQSHSELLTAYLAHLKERGLGQRRLHEVGEVVEAFLRSDQDGTRVFTAPLDALGAYLAGLAHQRRGPLARYRIRRIVMQFLEYLSSEGMLGPRARLSPRRMVLRRVRDAFAMVRPTTMLKLGWIAAVFVAYRLLSTLPISSVLTAVRDGQVIRFPSPTLAYQLVDQLLLAGAFHALALGMVGVAPLVCVDLLLARFGPQGRSPLLYLPLALILSAVAGQRVVATTWTGEQPGWSAVALLATSLFLVSCILMLLIWSVRYVGFITGVELVLLGNALVLGWQLWDEQSHQADGRAVAGLVLLGLVLSMLRVRAARVPVELVRTAKFDLETGNVSNVTTRAQISLSPGSYHYLAALLIVLVVGAWIGRIGVPTSGALAPLGDLSPRLLAVLGFACLALWLSFKRSDYQLSRRNVAAFLRGRDLFVAGAATWDRAVSDIRRRVRRRQMLDATIQAMLVGLLWLAVASGSAGLSWQETLYRLAILLSALQLFALVGRRAAGSLHGASASTTGVLSIPPADEDEGPWMRRSWRRLRTRYGRLELVGFALALWGVLWPLLRRIPFIQDLIDALLRR
ncbi:MAG TPA: DEAD/DEAH box helicase [Actinomycetota bacterium]|nr:DEAD/DEAH box helicase [Actinomycetota bacterium]